MCTHVCKCKNVETVPGIRRGGMGGEKWKWEFKYDIFDTLSESL
jgi:hypothetical protein